MPGFLAMVTVCVARDARAGDRAVLPASESGPRTIWLATPARAILAALPRRDDCPWVFPGPDGDEPMNRNALLYFYFWYFWNMARDEAGIVADARLHDLRHSHAPHAIMNGEGLHMTGRLPGHRRAATTNHYAHLDGITPSEAADRVASPEISRVNSKISDRCDDYINRSTGAFVNSRSILHP